MWPLLLLRISHPPLWSPLRPPHHPPLQYPLRCCCYRRRFPIGARPRRGGSAQRSRRAADPPRIRRRMVERWCLVSLPKACERQETNSTSYERRAASPFRTAPMTSSRRERVAPISTAFGRRAPRRGRGCRRLPTAWEAGTAQGRTSNK